MTNDNRIENRDEVLFAFHQAYARPTAEQIVEWVDRHPQFAEDIRAYAAVAWEWADCESAAGAEVDESLVANAYSRALNLVWKAKKSILPPQASAARSFSDIIAARNKNVPQIAQEIGIERGVVADLFSGRMLAPIGRRFMKAVNDALEISPDEFEKAHQCAINSPRMGLAKADQAPGVIQRRYEEIIRSTVTPDRQAYWLEKD